MSSEKFCLRWNDFESNISNAFKELRDDKDFFDITLACDDEQIQAHKVILAACSPFFRNILRRNHHQHPLLYMKGVKYTDLQAVLNFMYHGEVNVAQEELNSFLAVAEDLRVKGLTQNQSSSPQSTSKKTISHQQRISSPPPVSKTLPRAPEREPPKSSKFYHPPSSLAVQEEDDIQEVVPIKSEPLSSTPLPRPHVPIQVQSQAYSSAPQHPPQDQTVATYQEETGYEEYEDYQDQVYTEADNSMDHNITMQGTTSGKVVSADPTMLNDYIKKDPSTGMFVCQFCGKENLQKNNIRKHIEGVHFTGSFVYKCEICNKDFNGKNSLSTHLYKYHGSSTNK